MVGALSHCVVTQPLQKGKTIKENISEINCHLAIYQVFNQKSHIQSVGGKDMNTSS